LTDIEASLGQRPSPHLVRNESSTAPGCSSEARRYMKPADQVPESEKS
jgi:hypothetical protein